MKKKKIIITGENRLLVDALRFVLASDCGLEAYEREGTEPEALREITAENPDLLVLCERSADEAAVQTMREALRRAKKLRVLFIIRDNSTELFSLAGESTGVGIMPEASDLTEFKNAILSLLRGERYISRNVLNPLQHQEERQMQRDLLADITPREREVLYWMAKGLKNREISQKLILSEKTVKNHVSHILKKLETEDRTKAAAIAWEEGLPLVEEEFFSISSLRAVIK
ncbi:MAG: response regulator transcription factor [Synergistes sp.]|nr:response regulator transcription factor [Synergistes sp.]